MKRLKSLYFLFFLLVPVLAFSQEITYSAARNEENRDMSFEILGKMGANYVIYKNIRWKHVLTFYDKDMQIVKNHRIDFVPDKTFNMDIVLTGNTFMVLYQYQKNSVVYCRAVRLDSLGEKIGEPVTIDTTRLSILSDNKIYNAVPAQDKQHVLVYKMYKNHGRLNVVTKTFNQEFVLTDSSRSLFDYNERREIYSDLVLANDGKIFYTRGEKKGNRENIAGLTVFAKMPGQETIQTPITLQSKYLISISGKYDNLNGRFLINSLYANDVNSRTEGLFSAVVKGDDPKDIQAAFNPFPDNLRNKITSSGQLRFAFDDLQVQESVIKRDGGFVLMAEDQTTQTRDGYPYYNRYYYSPYSNYNNYYLYNPGYYGYYRPYGYHYYNRQESVRFYYDEILIVSVDKDLKPEWSSIIPKQQTDDENDNFISFGTMNTGGEIHFIYAEKDNNRQVLSNQGLLPDGEIKRYPTLKSRGKGYDFMPRYAKQVEYNVLIVPCMYRGSIAFAKVVF